MRSLLILLSALTAIGAEAPGWAAATGADPHGAWADLVVHDARQRLRWCPSGTYRMGSPEQERGRRPDEDLREVAVAAFWIADSECTQALWSSVMGSNPSRFSGPDRPVGNVSWDDCAEFLRRLNAIKPGLGARLPSEEEWEYACRAGTAGPFFDDKPFDDSAPNVLGWFDSMPHPLKGAQPVRTRNPNRWGIYDMHGNVSEWCQLRTPGAGEAPLPGQQALRGGNTANPAHACRSAARVIMAGNLAHPLTGFRLAIPARN